MLVSILRSPVVGQVAELIAVEVLWRSLEVREVLQVELLRVILPPLDHVDLLVQLAIDNIAKFDVFVENHFGFLVGWVRLDYNKNGPVCQPLFSFTAVQRCPELCLRPANRLKGALR